MLTAESYVARSQRRNRRGSHVALALIVGLTAAVSIAFAAGARRSNTVVDRFFTAELPYDVYLYAPGVDRATLQAIDGVERADPAPFVTFGGRDPRSGGVVTMLGTANDFAVRNPLARLLDGKWPERDDPDLLVVNQTFVEAFGAGPGDRVTLIAYDPSQRDDVQGGVYDPRGRSYEFTVAAVVKFPEEIAIDVAESPRDTGLYAADALTIVSGAFWAQHHEEFLDFGAAYDIELSAGAAGIDAFRQAAAAAIGIAPSDLMFDTESEIDSRRDTFSSPVDAETSTLLALGIGAALAALAALVILTHLERRAFQRDAALLRMVGFTPAQLAITAVLRTTLLAGVTAGVAAAGSIVMASRFPIGIGRQLELDRGLRVDVATTLLGALAVAIGIVAVAAALAPIRARDNAPRSRRRRAPVLPLPMSLGAHLAAGAGRRRTSAWVGAGAAVVAIAVMVGVATWVAGVDRLHSEAPRHGWVWDLAIGNVNFDLSPATIDRVTSDPRIGRATLGKYDQLALDGINVETLAFDTTGNAPPAIVDGRLPVAIDEIALGAGTSRTLGAGIGDTVTLSVAGTEFALEGAESHEIEMTVVGHGVSPVLGESDVSATAIVPLATIEAAGGNAAPSQVFVDVNEPTDATIAAITSDYTEEMASDVVPARVVSLRAIRALPIAGELLAAAWGLAVLVASLFAAARANRRSLAILGALGLPGRGQRSALTWQAVWVIACVLLVGIPLGLVTGAAMWRRLTGHLGVVPGSPVPVGTVLVVSALALVAAVITTTLSGRAAHDRVLTTLLRAE